MPEGKNKVCPLTRVPSGLSICWHVRDVWGNISEGKQKAESKVVWESWSCQEVS